MVSLTITADKVSYCAEKDVQSERFAAVALANAAAVLGPKGKLVLTRADGAPVEVTSGQLVAMSMAIQRGEHPNWPAGVDEVAFALFCDDLTAAGAKSSQPLKGQTVKVSMADAGLVGHDSYARKTTIELDLSSAASAPIGLTLPPPQSTPPPPQATAPPANPRISSKDVALARLRQDPKATAEIDPALLADKSFALACIAETEVDVRSFSAEVLADPDVQKSAVDKWYGQGPRVDPAIRKDFELYFVSDSATRATLVQEHASDPEFIALVTSMTDAGRFDPPYPKAAAVTDIQTWILIGQMNPVRAQNFPILKEIEGLTPESFERLRAEVKAANIACFERFASLAELREALDAIKNRDQGEPVVLIVARSDHNGAFHTVYADAKAHFPGRPIIYQEVTTPDEAYAALAAQANNPAKDVFVVAHGNPEGMALAHGSWLTPREMFRTSSGRDAARQGLAPGANIVLGSCSTGKGTYSHVNMANVWANLFPQATIYAPRSDSDGFAQMYDARGKLDPRPKTQQFASGGPAYRVGPLAPAP